MKAKSYFYIRKNAHKKSFLLSTIPKVGWRKDNLFVKIGIEDSCWCASGRER